MPHGIFALSLYASPLNSPEQQTVDCECLERSWLGQSHTFILVTFCVVFVQWWLEPK